MHPHRPLTDEQLPWRSFAAAFASRPADDRPFLTELDHELGTRREWDSADWHQRVLATGAWLRDQGVGPTDAVAAIAGNTADALAVAYGCWVLGACYVPLNPADTTARLVYAVQDAQPRLLIHSIRYADRAAEISAACPAVELVPADDLPGAVGRADSTTDQPDADTDTDAADRAAPDLTTPALRIYTSGTTGDPKAVVLTAGNLLVHSHALARELQWDSATRVMTVLPVHHVNGLLITSLTPWLTGSSAVLVDRFRSEQFWPDAAYEGATVSSVVPTLLEFLLATPGAAPAQFTGVLCGAGPLMVETVLDFETRFGVAVRHLYGLSETTAVSTMMPALADADRSHWHRAFGFPSIGPAISHTEVAVVAADGTALDAGRRGEIVVRGATVMTGYAGRPVETQQAFEGGWFHTGDEGFWQPGPAGTPYFFVTGRLKELIIRGGVNVSPFEIDEVLRSHRAVRYGLAVPFDNRFYGDEIAAYVVASEPVDAEEILAHCARQLDHARRPKVVVFGDDVPYTATGKAKRLELKTRLAPLLAQYRDVPFRQSDPSGRAVR